MNLRVNDRVRHKENKAEGQVMRTDLFQKDVDTGKVKRVDLVEVDFGRYAQVYKTTPSLVVKICGGYPKQLEPLGGPRVAR